MPSKRIRALLLAGGLSAAGLAAQGQTARIARLSHGGSLAAAEAADNFGLPSAVFRADTIVATSDSTAEARGRTTRWNQENEGIRSTRTIYYGRRAYPAAASQLSRGEAVRQLQQRYPKATLLGFDTLAKPLNAPAPPKPRRKRKQAASAGRPAGSLLPPHHPGVWLALAAIVGLSAAGLLLHDRPLPVFRRAVS